MNYAKSWTRMLEGARSADPKRRADNLDRARAQLRSTLRESGYADVDQRPLVSLCVRASEDCCFELPVGFRDALETVLTLTPVNTPVPAHAQLLVRLLSEYSNRLARSARRPETRRRVELSQSGARLLGELSGILSKDESGSANQEHRFREWQERSNSWPKLEEDVDVETFFQWLLARALDGSPLERKGAVITAQAALERLLEHFGWLHRDASLANALKQAAVECELQLSIELHHGIRTRNQLAHGIGRPVDSDCAKAVQAFMVIYVSIREAIPRRASTETSSPRYPSPEEDDTLDLEIPRTWPSAPLDTTFDVQPCLSPDWDLAQTSRMKLDSRVRAIAKTLDRSELKARAVPGSRLLAHSSANPWLSAFKGDGWYSISISGPVILRFDALKVREREWTDINGCKCFEDVDTPVAVSMEFAAGSKGVRHRVPFPREYLQSIVIFRIYYLVLFSISCGQPPSRGLSPGSVVLELDSQTRRALSSLPSE